MGIEPTRPAWKAGILPLNYTRDSMLYYYTILLRICQGVFYNFFIFYQILSRACSHQRSTPVLVQTPFMRGIRAALGRLP